MKAEKRDLPEARMRLATLFCLLIALAGVSAAQEMNFPVGPRYLMTSGSPLLAQPIATPSLSFDSGLPSFQSLPQIGPVVENQPFTANPEVQGPNLFPIYYGYPMTSVVEITSAEPPRELPASITDVGVTGMTDPQSLRVRGYGVTLGENATFWKTHKPQAPRVYTNADIQRLRPI
jgi:hypothetical protein